jgi:hypothetical protein
MRIAVVDHSFHVTTGSSHFLHSLVGGIGTSEVFWCDRWTGGAGVDLDSLTAGRFDCIVFWQQLYEPDELERLAQTSRIVLMPMFDQYAGWKQTQWRRYRPWPFVSFSLELHRRLVRAGCQSLPVRYFPLIAATPAAARTRRVAGGLTGIFWQRERRIDWPLVSRVIGRLPVAKLYVRSLADPGQKATPIPDADRARFGIVDLPWFDHPDDYLALLDEIDFFVAPRKYEGIGMTFLEALARGKTVLAADRPTMNEYISHGDNGFLFSTRFPRPLPSLGDSARLAAEIARRNHTFADEWREGERLIVELVRTGTVPRTAGPTTTSRSRLASALRIFTG